MKTAVMRSMELTDDEKYDAIAAPVKPDFPYGLRISLTEKELKILDLDPASACVGGMIHGHFIARITDVHAGDNEANGPSCRVEAQIEDLAIESEDQENDESE